MGEWSNHPKVTGGKASNKSIQTPIAYYGIDAETPKISICFACCLLHIFWSIYEYIEMLLCVCARTLKTIYSLRAWLDEAKNDEKWRHFFSHYLTKRCCFQTTRKFVRLSPSHMDEIYTFRFAIWNEHCNITQASNLRTNEYCTHRFFFLWDGMKSYFTLHN